MSPEKIKSFNVGMAVLATIEPPEGGFSTRVIAAVCGVSQQTISNIERRALAKMRAVAAHRQGKTAETQTQKKKTP